MEFTFKIEIKGKVEKIWDYYSKPDLRYVWEEDLENIIFSGEIKTGTTGKMKLKNMPEMQFELIKIEKEKSYWDKTVVEGMGSIVFGHDILQECNKTYIKHTVRLEKECYDDSDLGILTGIFADVPKSMSIIKKAVEIDGLSI